MKIPVIKLIYLFDKLEQHFRLFQVPNILQDRLFTDITKFR